jgi:hypothetical protein
VGWFGLFGFFMKLSVSGPYSVEWYCHVFRVVTIRRVWDWIPGFIDTLYTSLRIIINYGAITELHTLHFTVTHTSDLSSLVASWQRIFNSLTVTLNHTRSLLIRA